jgi:hypothetical protein
MFKRLLILLTLAMSTATFNVNAEQSKVFGDYTVHFSAFTTDLLSSEVAKLYRIPRSRNRALLNISVLKKVMNALGSPVKANIHATSTNLSSQLRELKMRELNEDGATYYIAETTVNNEETLKYTLTITPVGATETYTFSFHQQFFTE